jgi:hypothetical protein
MSHVPRPPFYTLFTADLADDAFIGSGAVRSCYREPDGLTCVKFYTCQHKLHPKRKRSTRWRLFLTRHLFWFNINMQEWRYYQRLKRRLPPSLMAAFPERMEPLYSPRYGWGLRESLLLNYDGSATRLVEAEIQRLKGRAEAQELYQRTEAFLAEMVRYAVAVYDPRNILVQWTNPAQFVLRLVDFEPRAKAAVPGLTYLKWFVRHRVATRSHRYLKRLAERMKHAEANETG